MRKVITGLLESDPELTVVGTARDGLEAMEKAIGLAPDVVTLDVEMPRLDGLGALKGIMAQRPLPVVMVSSLTHAGADATIQALALGAVDFVPKPSGAVSLDLHKVRDEMVRKVKVAARTTPGRLRPWLRGAGAGRVAPVAPASATAPTRLPGPSGGQPVTGGLTRLVVVAASTGGPGALYRLLGPLPADLRAGLVVVQHMPPGFTRSLAAHLDQVSALRVREAAAGDRLADGLALVAPGGFHLVLAAGGVVALDTGPPRHGVRPAADVTLESVPADLARRALVVVLTGMGMDGARGAGHLKRQGAIVWVQDEESSVVWGMPRATAELGVADRVGSPEQLAGWLTGHLGRHGGVAAQWNR